jgi:hypothetical protein
MHGATRRHAPLTKADTRLSGRARTGALREPGQRLTSEMPLAAEAMGGTGDATFASGARYPVAGRHAQHGVAFPQRVTGCLLLNSEANALQRSAHAGMEGGGSGTRADGRVYITHNMTACRETTNGYLFPNHSGNLT